MRDLREEKRIVEDHHCKRSSTSRGLLRPPELKPECPRGCCGDRSAACVRSAIQCRHNLPAHPCSNPRQTAPSDFSGNGTRLGPPGEGAARASFAMGNLWRRKAAEPSDSRPIVRPPPAPPWSASAYRPRRSANPGYTAYEQAILKSGIFQSPISDSPPDRPGSASRRSGTLVVDDDLQQPPADRLRCLLAWTFSSDPRAIDLLLFSMFSHARWITAGITNGQQPAAKMT